jgi:Uma2 family endonuclease
MGMVGSLLLRSNEFILSQKQSFFSQKRNSALGSTSFKSHPIARGISYTEGILAVVQVPDPMTSVATSQSTVSEPTAIVYPSSDGEPLAETYVHLCAIVAVFEVLRQYLAGQQATVLANQFLYYAQGLPKLRVAPDVMVVFNVQPGGRENYKIWEEGQVPAVIFEMTSAGTQDWDRVYKKTLYEQLGVQEYWLFDPKGEWIENQLQGYRLRGEAYEPIEDDRSEALGLQLTVDEKLPIPAELAEKLEQARAEAEEARTDAEEARQRAEQLEAQLRALGVEPTR